MIPVRVASGSTLALPYSIAAGAWYTVRVSADAPVDVYVVDAEGRAQFEHGQPFKTRAGATNSAMHAFAAFLPYGVATVLIMNRHRDRDVSASVDVQTFSPGGPTGPTGSMGPTGHFG
jgi:hypothetical protein